MLFANACFLFAAIVAVCSAVSHSVKRAAEKRAEEAMLAAKAEREKAMREAAAQAKLAKERAAAIRKAEIEKINAEHDAEKERRRIEREHRSAEAHARKVARATELAELAERKLKAQRELNALRQSSKTPADHSASVPASKQTPSHSTTSAGNNAFKNHVVAFTGKLPGMTRNEAIAAVKANGGKAFETMPVGTTLLVVGDNPGCGKLDKADQWIGQVKKITPAQFNAMLHA